MHANYLLEKSNRLEDIFKQGIAGDTNSLAQDYLLLASTELGEFHDI